MSSDETWIVIHCPEKDSHDLVQSNDVICAFDEVEIGEEVTFHYPGEKSLLSGVVKGASKDYEAMRSLQDHLNVSTRPPREPSFHEDQPRRAVSKVLQRGFKAQLGMLTTKKGSSKSDNSSSSKVEKPERRISCDINHNSKLLSKPSNCVEDKRQPKSLPRAQVNKTNKQRNLSPKTAKRSVSPPSKKRKPLRQLLESLDSSLTSDSSSSDNVVTATNKSTSGASKKAVWSGSLGDTEVETRISVSPAEHRNTECPSSSKTVTRVEQGNGECSATKRSTSKVITSDSEEQSGSSDSSMELTAIEIAALKKLSRKKKLQDMSELLSLSSKRGKKQETAQTKNLERNATDQNREVNIEPRAKDASDHETNKENAVETMNNIEENVLQPMDDLHDSDDAFNGAFQSDVAKEGNPSHCGTGDDRSRKRRKRRNAAEILEHSFTGEFFRCKGDDPQVEKIHPDYDVFIKIDDLRDIKKRWFKATALARAAARKVFTDEALQQCSVAGQARRLPKTGILERRTALKKDGVNAILAFVAKRCDKKRWNKPDDSMLRQAINNLMYEERSLMG